nr:hypothetical protein [uncultured Lachnoclostridium sp.]
MPENSEVILTPAHVTTKGDINVEVGDTITLTIGVRISEDKTLTLFNPYVSGLFPMQFLFFLLALHTHQIFPSNSKSLLF